MWFEGINRGQQKILRKHHFILSNPFSFPTIYRNALKLLEDTIQDFSEHLSYSQIGAAVDLVLKAIGERERKPSA